MKKILLGALLLLSIASYSQDDSFMDKIGKGNGHGHNDDDDEDDEDNDDGPAAPIGDYLYVLGIVGAVYATKKLIKNKPVNENYF